MHTVIRTAILPSLGAAMLCLAVTPALAGADQKILDRHVANMKSGNLEGVLADYATYAVVVTPAGMVTPDGVFTGSETRTLFRVLTSKDNLPGNKTMQVKYKSVGPDTSVMEWVQYKGTPKEVSGHDVFVTRDNKIVFQTVMVNPPKK